MYHLAKVHLFISLLARIPALLLRPLEALLMVELEATPLHLLETQLSPLRTAPQLFLLALPVEEEEGRLT